MSLLPRVTEKARELVAREFDTRGPDVCAKEIIEHLEKDNPELLNMAAKCAADFVNPARAMVGFAMFYRLLAVLPSQAAAGAVPMLIPLPHVSAKTRAMLVAEIDQNGAEVFTRAAIAELEEDNPELLQMAHGFASGSDNYLIAMQGFALLYRSLVLESAVARTRLH
jgi:hypothetical protein